MPEPFQFGDLSSSQPLNNGIIVQFSSALTQEDVHKELILRAALQQLRERVEENNFKWRQSAFCQGLIRAKSKRR